MAKIQNANVRLALEVLLLDRPRPQRQTHERKTAALEVKDPTLTSRERHYTRPNPLRRLGMNAFFAQVRRVLPEVASVLDVGCGEGYAMREVLGVRPNLRVVGADLSLEALRFVADVCPQMPVCAADVTRLPFATDSFDLVLSLEVLEHLPDPWRALESLKRVTRRYLLVSVPNEPIYRALRMATGKDLRQWGNYPGHINHWSLFSFRAFLRRHGWEVLHIASPPPFIWTVAMCQAAQASKRAEERRS